MNAFSIIASITGIIGIVVSIVGLYFAQRANKDSEVANELAKTAITRADEANSIAVKANDLAQNANTISSQARDAAQDRIDYSWMCDVDTSAKTISITNNGAWPAHKVTLIIEKDTDVIRHIERDEMSAGEIITLQIESEINEFFETIRTKSIPRKSVSGGGVFIAGSDGDPVECVFTARIRFETPQGVKRSNVIEQRLRYCVVLGGALKKLK